MPLGSSLKAFAFSDAPPQHADRRQSPRYDMSGSVCLVEKDRDSTKVGIVRDISLGGAYVVSQQDLPTEKLLKLRFMIGADFEMCGYVCRKDRNGFAVNFENES